MSANDGPPSKRTKVLAVVSFTYGDIKWAWFESILPYAVRDVN